jgi:hypothetical protein
MEKLIAIKTCGTFSGNNKEYFYVLDKNEKYWIYLKPIFKTTRKCEAILQKYSKLSFQRKKILKNFHLVFFHVFQQLLFF